MDQVVKTKTWTTPIVERINLEFDKDMSNVCIASLNEPEAGCGETSSTGCFKTIVE